MSIAAADHTPILVEVLPSPVGPLRAAVRDGRLCLLAFDGDAWWERARRRLERRFPGSPLVPGPCATVREALGRYFLGELHAIDDLEVDTGGTAFQARVWDALRTIPAGQTRSYAEVARLVHAPAAVRAVAAANGDNPVAIVVPCHRVIGSDGSLTGYGGGLDRKAWLLRHEGALPRASAALPLFA